MESSIITYLVHWLFIEIANKYIVYDNNLSLIPGIIILTVFCLAGCVATYFLVLYVPYLGIVFGIESQKIQKQTRGGKKNKKENSN
jgi:hypothetical protein